MTSFARTLYLESIFMSTLETTFLASICASFPVVTPMQGQIINSVAYGIFLAGLSFLMCSYMFLERCADHCYGQLFPHGITLLTGFFTVAVASGYFELHHSLIPVSRYDHFGLFGVITGTIFLKSIWAFWMVIGKMFNHNFTMTS